MNAQKQGAEGVWPLRTTQAVRMVPKDAKECPTAPSVGHTMDGPERRCRAEVVRGVEERNGAGSVG